MEKRLGLSFQDNFSTLCRVLVLVGPEGVSKPPKLCFLDFLSFCYLLLKWNRWNILAFLLVLRLCRRLLINFSGKLPFLQFLILRNKAEVFVRVLYTGRLVKPCQKPLRRRLHKLLKRQVCDFLYKLFLSFPQVLCNDYHLSFLAFDPTCLKQ